jgi:[ribosomal protein S5]-alanine N-acetyltransferase
MITTDRLELHPFTIDTAQATADNARGELPWADGFPRDDDRDAARMFLQVPQAVFGSWFIVVKDSAEVVGTIGFFGPPDPDGDLMVGYGLISPARERGYATEALRALAEYGLAQPGAGRIVADPDLDNTASHRVLEKAGFVRTHATNTSQWYERRRAD